MKPKKKRVESTGKWPEDIPSIFVSQSPWPIHSSRAAEALSRGQRALHVTEDSGPSQWWISPRWGDKGGNMRSTDGDSYGFMHFTTYMWKCKDLSVFGIKNQDESHWDFSMNVVSPLVCEFFGEFLWEFWGYAGTDCIQFLCFQRSQIFSKSKVKSPIEAMYLTFVSLVSTAGLCSGAL